MRRLSGSSTSITTVSAANTTRQLRVVVAKPPISGPAAIEAPTMPPSVAKATARSGPWKLVAMSAAIAGITSTAPRPSTSDQPISSIAIEPLSAVVSDPTP